MKTNIVNKTLRTWYILPLYMVMMLGFSSCNLDYFPSDEMNSDLLLQDSKGAEYIMNACYAMKMVTPIAATTSRWRSSREIISVFPRIPRTHSMRLLPTR